MFLGFLIFLIIIFLSYHYWSFGYWRRKHVFSKNGIFLFGNIKEVIFSRKSLPEIFSEIYRNHKSEGLIGFYSFYRPMLLITEPEIIKTVLVKEFNSFSDNGFRVYASADPMFGINPFCTTGIQKCIQHLQYGFCFRNYIENVILQVFWKNINFITQVYPGWGEGVSSTNISHINNCVSVLDVTGNYTIDNVASCAYGLEPSAFSNPENGFKKHAAALLFSYSSLANFSALFFPKLALLLSLRIVSKHAEDFFVAMVKLAKDIRMKTHSQRPDLIGHLMKHNQKLIEENKEGLSDLEFAGHCITFYLDGYETSSSALSFLLLELANHPEVQEKLREEIILAGKDVNDFSYEKVNALPYLTMVLNESMRLHPLLPILSRECTEKVTVGDRIIDKGTKVFIPVNCLHYDPDLFPEPKTFNPQRFEYESNITKYSFLPFGEGPRMCLGFRFAQLQLKLAIIQILLNFRIFPAQGKVEIINDEESPFVVLPNRKSQLIFQLI